MKQRLLAMSLAMALLLTGCGLVRDTYVSVQPHENYTVPSDSETIKIADYNDLRGTLRLLIIDGVTETVFTAENYDGDLERDSRKAISYIMNEYAEGSYVVNRITPELVQAGNYSKLKLTITYDHDFAETDNATTVGDTSQIALSIHEALMRNDERLLLRVTHFDEKAYAETDYDALVTAFFEADPVSIMSKPTVTCQLSPSNLNTHIEVRMLEINFTYPTAAETLIAYKGTVDSLINSAAEYVLYTDSLLEKASLLYSYLAELHLYDTKDNASSTPAYSLLTKGKADSRTFAAVYCAMCQRANLTCQVVNGTKNAEPYCWTILELDDGTWHVDALADEQAELRRPRFLTDAQMNDYDWDHDAYPICAGAPEPANEEAAAPQQIAKTPSPPSDTPTADPAPVEDQPADDPTDDTKPQENQITS